MSNSDGADKVADFSQAPSSAENKAENIDNNYIIRRLEQVEEDVAAFITGRKEANDAITAYVNDLKADLNALRKMRFWSVLFSFSYVTIINILLGVLIWLFQDYFKGLSPYTQTVFIIVTVSSAMTVLIAVLRGSFKTYNERHKDDYIPPHLQIVKKILERAEP